jgi:acetyl-CoA carboxylase carboxyltransferase component
VADAVQQMRGDYEHQLDAKFAAARGFVDTILVPEDTRRMLAFALRVTRHYAGPHIGPFVLPPLDVVAE